MGIVSRDSRRAAAKAFVLLIPVLAIVLLWGQTSGHAAGNMRFVEGIVTSVSGTEIVVGGKTYNIAGARLMTGPRKSVSPAELSPGTEVTLSFRGGVLISVAVHAKIVK